MLCIFSTLLLLAVTGLLLIDLLVVLLSYSIFWYEYSNSHPAAVECRLSWRNLRKCLSLMLPEVFFNFVTVSVFPLGLIPGRTAHLQRGTIPVLLLHGLFDNQASWFWFKRGLKKAGVTNIVTMNLSSWHNEEILTELVAKKVDELRHQLGVNQVYLVGHSMGGMIARNYIQMRGGADKVAKLVCLGSPHHGSRLAPFSVAPLGKQLIPGSHFLQRLNAAPPPSRLDMTNIYTRTDNMVLPNANCQLDWGNSVELDGLGHTALIYRQASLKATLTALQREPGKQQP